MKSGIGENTASPALKKLIESLKNPAAFYENWAQAVVRLSYRNARAKSQGGVFWKGIADATQITEAGRTGATVENKHFAGAHKHFGGVIRAKNVRALTIPHPDSDEAKGKTAGDFKAGGRRLFVLPGGKDPEKIGTLGYSTASGQFRPLFVLRTSVSQKPEPWWPSEKEVGTLGLKEAEYWLNNSNI